MASTLFEGWCRRQFQMQTQPLMAQIWVSADELLKRRTAIALAGRPRAKPVEFSPPPATGPCFSQQEVCVVRCPEKSGKPAPREQVNERFSQS